MGGGESPKTTIEQTVIDPALRSQFDNTLASYQKSLPGLANQSRQAAGGMQTNFSQFNPNLRTDFTPQAGLNAFSQNVLAKGYQDANAKAEGVNRGLAAKYASNPALLRILQSQNAMRGAAETNPLLFQTGVMQRAGDQQQWGAENSAKLQQTQSQAGLAAAGNEALGQRFQMQQVPAQLQQGLLAVLSQFAAATGQRKTSQYESPSVK